MFKIEFMVDDRKLPNALRSLASLGAYDVKSVPVVGAEPTKNGAAKSNGNGTSTEVVLAGLKGKHKGTIVTSDFIIQLLVAAGLSASGLGHVRNKLVEIGKLKMVGKGKYEVRK